MRNRLSDKVYAVTEQARHSCEVNYLCKHGADFIKSYLEKVQEKRGFLAYKKLRDDVAKIWRNNGASKN